MRQWQFIVLDRDGAINGEREYQSGPDQFELLPGAVSGVRYLHSRGWLSCLCKENNA